MPGDDFTTDSALTVGAIEAMVRRGDFSFIMPPESAVMKYPAAEIEKALPFIFSTDWMLTGADFSCGGEYPGRAQLCGCGCAAASAQWEG